MEKKFIENHIKRNWAVLKIPNEQSQNFCKFLCFLPYKFWEKVDPWEKNWRHESPPIFLRTEQFKNTRKFNIPVMGSSVEGLDSPVWVVFQTHFDDRNHIELC